MAVARDQGLDESTVAKTDHYRESDLSDRHKAALAVADAVMTQPADLSGALLHEARKHFSRSELIELTVDIMKWNYQKVPVALGTDRAVQPGVLTDLIFDERGHWVRPGRRPETA